MNKNIDTGVYSSERKRKAIFKLIMSLVLLLGGVLVAYYSIDGLLKNAGLIANFLGVYLMITFILDDKDYLFPVRMTNNKKE